MSITVQNHTEFQITIPRDRIPPSSLLETTLELDPSAELINLVHPVVTDNSLIAVKSILADSVLPNVVPSPEY